MTSIDKDSFAYNSLGHQSQSQRQQDPIYSISKVSREARRNVFITERHIKANRLGRESPVNDTINVPSTLNTNNRDALCAAPSFGYGGRSDFTTIKVDPDSIPTNDAMDLLPDNQQFRYRRDPTIIIGTEPRFQLKDAELIGRHQAAFIGRESPGPAAVGDEYGPKFEATKPRMAPARKFGIKTYLKWDGQGDNPPEVGPGTFERKDSSMGPQHLTKRRNQSTHAFPKGPKLSKSLQSDDIISKYDVARSSLGKQVLNKNRSAPSVGFNQDTRDIRSKTQICMTKLDLGPRANFAPVRIPMPSLPSEKAVLANGFG